MDKEFIYAEAIANKVAAADALLIVEIVVREVAAERERCATMAGNFANRAWNDARSEAWSDEFELLARNIRGA